MGTIFMVNNSKANENHLIRLIQKKKRSSGQMEFEDHATFFEIKIWHNSIWRF